MKSKPAVLFLLLLAIGLFAIYVYSCFVPATASTEALTHFSRSQIEDGHRYWQQKQRLFALRLVVQVGFLAALVLTAAGHKLHRLADNIAKGKPWVSAMLFGVLIWFALRILTLPISLYNGYVMEHRWGFSTLSLSGWTADYVKGAVLDFVMFVVGMGLFYLALHRWQARWWWPASVFVAGWLVIQTFLWPIVIAPLYNRFEPVAEEAIVSMVEELAVKAGITVKELLVMDASRRSTKANAYFAGLGAVKRIVLYDTLLDRYPMEEVQAVIAHEMAHWRLGHIPSGLLLGTVAVAGQLYALSWIIFSGRSTPWTLSSAPGSLAIAMLFILLSSFIASPLQNGISRHMEREADALSVALVGSADGAVALQIRLARQNLADIVPVPFMEWFSYSHPSVLKRIEWLEQKADGS